MKTKAYLQNKARVIAIVLLSLVFAPQYSDAQGIWERIKKKSSEIYHSGSIEEGWEKSTSFLDSKRYKVPVMNRKFINVIPDKYILSLSEDQYRSYLRSNKASTNQKYNAQVKRVAERLSAATKKVFRYCGMDSELSSYKWEFHVVKNSDANAFCMPGGKIVVYEGIMPIAGDDASLAVVLGHEIAHAIAKHSSEQMTKTVIQAGGMALVYSLISMSDMSERKKIIASVLAAAGYTLATLKFSRLNETEADKLGLILAAVAGYNISAGIDFWKRMGKNSGSTSSRDWYSTHPSNTNRINTISSYLSEAKSIAARIR